MWVCAGRAPAQKHTSFVRSLWRQAVQFTARVRKRSGTACAPWRWCRPHAPRARGLSRPPGLSRPRAAARYTAIGGRTPPPHTGGGSPGERGAGPGGGAPPAATAASVRQRESETPHYRRKGTDSGITARALRPRLRPSSKLYYLNYLHQGRKFHAWITWWIISSSHRRY